MSVGEKVHVLDGAIPGDYHCSCEFCQRSIGELRPPDGGHYSRLERRQYYDPSEKGKGGHIAKTPLHIARWAVQQFSREGEWVLDPTIGSGTTAVEAVTQGRSAAGMELEYGDILRANVQKSIATFKGLFPTADVPLALVAAGDAREIRTFLASVNQRYALVVNNPPYLGDISMPSPKGKLTGKAHRHLETRFDYDKTLPNIAFLKEGPEYLDTIKDIYQACADYLVAGGHFVVGVKDMMRDKKPFLLHHDLCLLQKTMGLEHVGNAFLKHHPSTLFLNTYEKFYGVRPPLYQTISVFRK